MSLAVLCQHRGPLGTWPDPARASLSHPDLRAAREGFGQGQTPSEPAAPWATGCRPGPEQRIRRVCGRSGRRVAGSQWRTGQAPSPGPEAGSHPARRSWQRPLWGPRRKQPN